MYRRENIKNLEIVIEMKLFELFKVFNIYLNHGFSVYFGIR